VPDEVVVGEGVRAVAAVEEMALALVAAVEVSGVEPLEPLHAPVEVGLRRLDEQVEVVPHEAVGQALPRAALDDVADAVEEPDPIARVEEDRQPHDPAVEDVVDAAGDEWTRRSRHPVDRTPATRHKSPQRVTHLRQSARGVESGSDPLSS